jgi:transmembrane sensor
LEIRVNEVLCVLLLGIKVKNENNDIVKELIPRYLAGEASVEEEKQLLAWIAMSPGNEQEYLASKRISELSKKHYAYKNDDAINIDIDAEWNQFVRNINTDEKKVRTLADHKSSTPLFYKIAATVSLLILTGYLINYFVTKTTDFKYETADNTRIIILPDGSEVTLNKHSHLAYTSDFGKGGRNVKLTGEAFFNIKRDTLNPFKIEVNKAAVEVLGTSFNVRAYDYLKEVEVIVKTGIVKLSVPERKKEVQLIAGQKGVYRKTNESIISGVNEDINFLSWNTQKIVFMENDLRTVVETLNKTYQANIVIKTDIPASCEVTVSFDHQTLEAVLHVLERTLNLTYTIKGNQIEITGAGC